MSADANWNIEGLRNQIQIRNCQQLSSGFCQAADIKVLFPTNQRAVCSAEGHIDGTVIKQIGNRGHLCGLFFIQVIHVPAQLHVSESPACDHRLHQKRCSGCKRRVIQDIFPAVYLKKTFIDFRYGNRLAVRWNKTREIRVRQFGENKIVYIIERCNGKRDIRTPFQIVEQIRHKQSSLSFTRFFTIITNDALRFKACWP